MWTQNGKVIATNATLFIESVDESHESEYVCKAMNDYGETNLSFYMQVLSEFRYIHFNDAIYSVLIIDSSIIVFVS